MQAELAEHPPADDLLAFYFQRQEWWSPPSARTAFAGEAGGDAGEWASPYPDVTE